MPIIEGIAADPAVGRDASHHFQILSLHGCARGHEEDRGCVIDAGGVARCHRAVRLEGGLELREGLCRHAGAGELVLIEDDRIALLLGYDDGDYLGAEASRLDGGDSLALRRGGQRVLIRAGDAVLRSEVFRGDAHVVAVEDFPKAVLDHLVDEGAVAHAIARARLVEEVGRLAHGLRSAGHDDLGVPRLDLLSRVRDGAKAGAADHVDGHSGLFDREAGLDRYLTGYVLSQARLEDAAQENFVDVGGRYARPLQELYDGNLSEVDGGEGGEGAAEAADRGPDRACDEDIVHALLLFVVYQRSSQHLQVDITTRSPSVCALIHSGV